jgi:3-dehydroquinate synthase
MSGADAKRHLVLVGMMGSGKSTVGRACAAELGRELIDTDALVEEGAGRSVAEIFASAGEAEFRERERRAVFEACDRPPAVIACGGGAVLDADSRARLRATGVVVWLDAPPAVLAARIDDGAGRPLIAHQPEPVGALTRLAHERSDAYTAAADVVVDAAADVDTVTASALEGFCLHARQDPSNSGEVIRVDVAPRPYDVIVGTQAHAALVALLGGRRRAAVVTQPAVSTVAAHLAAALEASGIEVGVSVIDDGEPAKSLATVETLVRDFAVAGLLRRDAVVAVGGGVVGDTAGFAAAVYHRGVDLVQVPTTLLAMVDAAIGGKTAVNIPEGKNLVGAFHQPVAVLCDPSVLASLSDREYRCGLGEVAKYALLGDRDLETLLTHKADAVLARDAGVLTEMIARSAALKARVVAEDPEERTGARASLNYGHTLAHAIETVSDFDLAHGEAVAIGLVFAAELAAALERVPPAEVARHRALLSSLDLPTSAPPGLRRADLVDAMHRDKKAAGGLTFVLAGAADGGVERVDDPPATALDAAFTAIGVATS